MTLVNGIASGEVSVFDRGLAYGDGLFETIAVVGQDVLNWPQHVARLGAGCERLALAVPDFEQLFRETRAVAGGFERSVVKITITRGAGGASYTPARTDSPTRIVARRAWPEAYAAREQAGVRVCVAEHRLAQNPTLAGLKHLNRLDQVLASMELCERDVDEALMLDPDGRVIEATRCNLFAVHGGRLSTPRLDNCGVTGIMRSVILQVAPAAGLAAGETALTLDDLRTADELFLCNAVAGIWPIIELDEPPRQSFRVGAVTRRLQSALMAGGYHR